MGTPRRAVAAWVLYDFADSAFATVVATFVVATYFTQAVAPDPITGTAQWATMQAIAGLLIALLAVPTALLRATATAAAAVRVRPNNKHHAATVHIRSVAVTTGYRQCSFAVGRDAT